MFQSLTILVTLFFSVSTQATDSWKKISQSFNGCGEKYEIYAKEGERFLKLKSNNSWIELRSLNQEKFKEESPMQLRFLSSQHDFEYIQPSIVDGNLPRLIIKNNKVKNCKMLSTID